MYDGREISLRPVSNNKGLIFAACPKWTGLVLPHGPPFSPLEVAACLADVCQRTFTLPDFVQI